MKILLTGGAGYIGSVMTRGFLKLGHKVTVIDNLMYRQSSLLGMDYWRFKFILGDARDDRLMNREIPKADVIIPLACIVGVPACDRSPTAARTTNLEAVKLVSSISSLQQRILYPNTNSGYGVSKESDGELVHCTEETPLNPISQYGKSKCAAEEYLLKNPFGKANATVFRLATVFGISPRMRLDLLVNDFTYRAQRDKNLVLFEPHFKRNYIHVHDVFRAMECCMELDKAVGEVYNVGLSDANLSKVELAQVIKQLVPDLEIICSEHGKDPDKRNYIVSNKKLEATGWSPLFDIEDGVKEILDSYDMIHTLHERFNNL